MMFSGDEVGRSMDFPFIRPSIHLSVTWCTLQIVGVLSNTIQLSNTDKNRALISTFLTIKTTWRAAQRLIRLVNLSCVDGAVI